jgi:DNA-binding transcriptional regulator YhcF (GntR family)
MQYVIHQFMPIPNAPPNLEKRSMREDVYAVLREWIVIGTLEPGEKLRDVDIAAHLGVSRTPVREALRRLEDEGLIETKQNAWTRVSGVTGALAARIYPILQALEPLALELAAPHLTRADLRAMPRVNKHIRHALEVNDARAAAVELGREIVDDDVILETGYAGQEYGVPTDDTLAAMRLAAQMDGMITDPVYEGKSMHGLIDMIRSGVIPQGSKVLYAHLGGVPALNAYAALFK